MSASQLLTNASLVLTGSPLRRLEHTWVAVDGQHIAAVGSPEEVRAQVDVSAAEVFDLDGKLLAPGFVDSHTHLVFGGTRAPEYAAKMTHSAAEIRALGIPAGILSTVSQTRAASLEELTHQASARLHGLLAHGVTTVESKSGYGLNTATELKLLEVNQRLQAAGPVDIVSTFLGAHDLPPDEARAHYLERVIHEMIPEVARRKLAEFCDVFVDEGYYTAAEARRILQAGREHGLRPKLHADQYSASGASALAAELGAVSADHLNYTERADLERMAQAGVVAVGTPALDFAVRHARPFNARAMLQAGLTLALATDLCPACWVESMPLVLQLACRQHALSPDEALSAATLGGARALGLTDRGQIAPGQLADLQVWEAPAFEDIIYRLGHNPVVKVMKRGRWVA